MKLFTSLEIATNINPNINQKKAPEYVYLCTKRIVQESDSDADLPV